MVDCNSHMLRGLSSAKYPPNVLLCHAETPNKDPVGRMKETVGEVSPSLAVSSGVFRSHILEVPRGLAGGRLEFEHRGTVRLKEWRYEGLSPAGLPLFAFLYFPSCSWKALLSSHWRREPRETNINPVKAACMVLSIAHRKQAFAYDLAHINPIAGRGELELTLTGRRSPRYHIIIPGHAYAHEPHPPMQRAPADWPVVINHRVKA
ncbi:hypothetical protein SVAN01_05920 [Stagonosporopsis vannaccii]|nr:hypothetical protein SVAN01_05920 [Stagonosporopsis vannaccii]